MNNPLAYPPLLWSAFTFLALAPAAAQEQLVVDGFDTEETAAVWSATWGTAPELTWDTADRRGSSTSGSLRVSADYFTPADNGWEQMVITRNFDEPIVGSDYVSVSIDVKVDPSSVQTSGGNYGYFEFKRPNSTAMGGVNLTSTEWTTITFNLAPTEGPLTGLIIQNGSGTFQGPITYYLDNLVFTKAAGGPAPPTLTIEKSRSPGLRLFASAPGQAYQRQNIVFVPSEDLATGLWWVNQPEPVTYSVTWGDFPNRTQDTGFQGHLMLATDSSGAASPDWNDAHVIMIEFQYVNTAGPDETPGNEDDQRVARARLLHKVNEPAANGMLYRTQANAAAGPVGVLGELTAPSMLGTWSVRLQNDNKILLTAPDNSVQELTMPSEDAPYYEPATKGVSALFGVQPNSDTRIGLSATLAKIKISQGNQVVVEDTFQTAELDPARWTIRAQDASGIFTTGPDLAYVVSWNLPDTGFSLRGGPRLKGPWATTADPLLVGARRVALIKGGELPSAQAGFFYLVK